MHFSTFVFDPMLNRKQMCSRLMSLGIPKSESSQLLDKLDYWKSHNGEEWTVEHLKEVKLLYLHKLAGTHFKSKHWIAKNDYGIPKGPLKVLFKLSSKNLSRVLTAFTSYSASLSNHVTEKQKKKFFSSMCSDDKRGMDSKLQADKTPVVSFQSNSISLIEYCTSSNKRAPYPNGRTGPETNLIDSIAHAMQSWPIRSIIERNSEVFRKVIPFDACMSIRPKWWTEDEKLVNTLGHISGIQEPGFKLRAIANPNRVLQSALEPLKSEISLYLRSKYESDCTFDQQKAIPVIQGWLRERRTVYSVDLSDATNLFPWPLQRELLLDTFRTPQHRQLIGIMDQCATGPWLTRLRGQPETVRFTRGQPLGLGPSFATFAYAHNVLLAGICAKHGIEPRFRVLGDDVVIADSQLHRIYRTTLNNLGCRVSLSKTFESKTMAEFAGTTVLADRIGHGYKWRQMSDHSFIDAARNLGKLAKGMMNPFQREVTDLIAPIPKGLGGLGWSDGRKLSELVSPIYDHAITHYVNKEVQAPMMYRDLVAETWSLTQAISASHHQSPIFRVDILSGGDKITVSDLLQSHRFNGLDISSRVYPREIMHYPQPDFALPRRYYPITERDGDPRPSVLPLIRSIALLSHDKEQPLSKRVDRWIKAATVAKPSVNKGVPKIPEKEIKVPTPSPPTKVRGRKSDKGMSM